MNIVRAVAADAGEIMTVQRAAYVSEAQLYDTTGFSALSEPVESVRSAIETEVVLVARVGPRIVGAVRGRIDGTVCHVERLVVAPDQQGQGVGRELMLAVEDHVPPSVERFALHTGDRSTANLHLYRKVGYEQTREERVADTLSLIHMEKPVTSTDR
jgi:ribosomal protein S18 acetylase RimI-like enzyme